MYSRVPTPRVSRVGRQRIAQRSRNVLLARFTFLAREANDFAGRTECHGEFNGFVDVLANANLSVESLEADVSVAGTADHRADHDGGRHRKTSRPTVSLMGITVSDSR